MLQGLVSRLFGWPVKKRRDVAEEAAGEAGQGDDEPALWVSVLTAFDIVQATLAVARLRDEGIPAMTRREAASSVYPVSVGILGRMDVMVPEEQAEKARMVLDAEPVLDTDEETSTDGLAGEEAGEAGGSGE